MALKICFESAASRCENENLIPKQKGQLLKGALHNQFYQKKQNHLYILKKKLDDRIKI